MAARLSFDERKCIEAMLQAGVKAVGIAEALGRHRSTIYREFKRSGCRGVYDAAAAQAAQAGAWPAFVQNGA